MYGIKNVKKFKKARGFDLKSSMEIIATALNELRMFQMRVNDQLQHAKSLVTNNSNAYNMLTGYINWMQMELETCRTAYKSNLNISEPDIEKIQQIVKRCGASATTVEDVMSMSNTSWSIIMCPKCYSSSSNLMMKIWQCGHIICELCDKESDKCFICTIKKTNSINIQKYNRDDSDL